MFSFRSILLAAAAFATMTSAIPTPESLVGGGSDVITARAGGDPTKIISDSNNSIKPLAEQISEILFFHFYLFST